jgi:hypothetical protein
MVWALIDLIGGWKEVRASAGFSYQISRNGKRRIVPIEGYRSRGLRDEQWIETGVFADEKVSERFRNFSLDMTEKTARPKNKPKRVRLAKRDFAING